MPTIKKSIDERFIEFHRANPHVYSTLVEIGRTELLALGIRRFSTRLLVDRLRWTRFIDTRGQHEFKISNDFTALYARLIAANEPDFAHAFTFRERRTDPNVRIDDDESNVEFDLDPIMTCRVSSPGRCPECGATRAADCACEPEVEPERETLESRNGVEFFEGWESMAEWR